MTDVVEESGYREVIVDEESELIKTLREEIKFLREMNLELIKHRGAPVAPLARTISSQAPQEVVIEDFSEARVALEAHFYKEAERQAEEKRKNEEKHPKA